MNDQAEQDWADCEEFLAKALSHDQVGGFTLADVKSEIERGLAHFWRWPQDRSEPPTAAAVTEFVIYPRGKALNYWLFGGDMESIRAMLPLVEDWGVSQGCTAFSGAGRPGFARAFAADGYRAVATLYLKSIPRGRLQ